MHDSLYERARYNLAIAYNQEPVPSLPEKDAVWADRLLRETGHRNN